MIDVACGTGPMLPDLARRVGADGRVIGIEHSPEMIALARRRVEAQGIERNVTLVEAPAEEFAFEARADALLFFYAHDVLQSPAALARLFAHTRPGARVVVAGARFRHWGVGGAVERVDGAARRAGTWRPRASLALP